MNCPRPMICRWQAWWMESDSKRQKVREKVELRKSRGTRNKKVNHDCDEIAKY